MNRSAADRIHHRMNRAAGPCGRRCIFTHGRDFTIRLLNGRNTAAHVIENLVRMANQIGAFFEAMPDRAEAMQDLATHIRKFWEPRMRQALLAHVDQAHGEGLLGIVSESIALHRARLEPHALVA